MITPVEIKGFKCYAPELAYDNEGFPPNMFDILAELEENNFWFKARNIIIQNILNKYVGKNNNYKFLEIGCGNGYVLKGLLNCHYQLVGSEIYIDGLINVKKRLPDNVELIQLNALNIPFENTFDIIGAFDVIEHIDDDEKVMQEVFKALKSNGYFLITVPQYQWMWSYLDDSAKHKRRYTQKEIHQKLIKNKFQIIYSSSFVTSLFPFVVLSRFLMKNKPLEKVTLDDLFAEFKIPNWLNNLFYRLMLIDAKLIKYGISLPFGNSIVILAKKK